MIYTITFNPSLDYVMNIDTLTVGHTNRSQREQITVGGKGINVSLVLAQLGIKSVSLGFVGGFTGDALERMLGKGLIMTDFVRVCKGDTRINVKLIDERMTEINAGGPFVSEDEVEALLKKTDALKDGDTIVIAGSAPKNVSDDIYEKILERLEGRNIKAVVDATGKLLLKTLKYKPYLIKPNVDELGEMFGTKISCESDILKYAGILKDMGAQNVLISMGKDGAILVDELGAVRKRAAVGTKAVNPVGAGDSMVAGFLAGASVDYDRALAYGIAAGGATACSEGLATKELIDQFLKMTDDSFGGQLMSRIEEVELTNMCMVYDENGNVLVQDKKHPTWNGWNFPGGHVEKGESITASVIREVYEETGLHIKNPRLCGIKEFHKSSDGKRYIVFLYKTNEFTGEIHSSEEGNVFWWPFDKLDSQKLVSSFDEMLKVFTSDDISEVFYQRCDGSLNTVYY